MNKDQGIERTQSMNGKRGPPPQRREPLPPTTSQHDDLIKYIFDSWNKVWREMQQNSNGAQHIGYYHEPHSQLKDFEPFDLEAWWGRRVVENFTQQS
ncbi:MAPK regulated corepressor interacting protein 2 [Lycorma delicatula]|uniref:MAPK regulated corepressor interacting protein 2 n=1 Tax=Lycorma delicatula TaxID=130591 RepID=UPI003F511C40